MTLQVTGCSGLPANFECCVRSPCQVNGAAGLCVHETACEGTSTSSAAGAVGCQQHAGAVKCCVGSVKPTVLPPVTPVSSNEGSSTAANGATTTSASNNNQGTTTTTSNNPGQGSNNQSNNNQGSNNNGGAPTTTTTAANGQSTTGSQGNGSPQTGEDSSSEKVQVLSFAALLASFCMLN